MPLATGQLRQNRYRIGALLGQGGMGSVYRAWDTSAVVQAMGTDAQGRYSFPSLASSATGLRSTDGTAQVCASRQPSRPAPGSSRSHLERNH